MEWTGLFNSNAASTLIGAMSGLAGFFANEFLHRRRRKVERQEKYVAEILAANAEIAFYNQKLREISSDSLAIVEQSQNFPSMLLRPSYKVYPNHLEKLKTEICGQTKNRELAIMLVQCHYDLSHIAEKLESLAAGKTSDFMILNAKQLSRVCDSTVNRFASTSALLEIEAKKNS